MVEDSNEGADQKGNLLVDYFEEVLEGDDWFNSPDHEAVLPQIDECAEYIDANYSEKEIERYGFDPMTIKFILKLHEEGLGRVIRAESSWIQLEEEGSIYGIILPSPNGAIILLIDNTATMVQIDENDTILNECLPNEIDYFVPFGFAECRDIAAGINEEFGYFETEMSTTYADSSPKNLEAIVKRIEEAIENERDRKNIIIKNRKTFGGMLHNGLGE